MDHYLRIKGFDSGKRVGKAFVAPLAFKGRKRGDDDALLEIREAGGGEEEDEKAKEEEKWLRNRRLSTCCPFHGHTNTFHMPVTVAQDADT